MIQEAIATNGFVIADVRLLDKQQNTFKQINNPGAVEKDLVISAYKPEQEFEGKFQVEAGTEAGAWDFVRSHLKQLPVFVEREGRTEIIYERQSRLLFDRMVAFHVQRGVTLPISAADFYRGLQEQFPERDGMYFLPDQVSEYDRKRLAAKELLQLELFVTDEASAIQWLRQQLIIRPQTFQRSAQFLKEIGAWQKHEAALELSELLAQSFLVYDGQGDVPSQVHSYLSSNFKELRGLDKSNPALVAKARNRWYVPDPRKEADLEQLRQRALLKEFRQYQEVKGKVKVVRSEALRVGFKDLWQKADYQAIVQIAKRVPEAVVQEDPSLLMYYDNALMRTEG